MPNQRRSRSIAGPAGRRAGLVRGPDVWEIVGLLRGLQDVGDERIRAAASWLGLVESQIRTAVAYYAEFADEIDQEIDDNLQAQEQSRAALEAQQRLLGCDCSWTRCFPQRSRKRCGKPATTLLPCRNSRNFVVLPIRSCSSPRNSRGTLS